MFKWFLFTAGRIFVVLGETLFSVFTELGWKWIDRFGTRRQKTLFGDKRTVALLHELRELESELAKTKQRAVSQAPTMPPPEGIN